MNQNEFNNMSADRLETLITCQRKSTELEIMLAKRLVESNEVSDSRDGEISDLESYIERLEHDNGEAEEALSEIEELANGDDVKEAIEAILKVL